MSPLLRRGVKPAGRKVPIDPLKIGIGVVIGLIVLSYAGFHKRFPFQPRWKLNAVFSISSQLRKGSPVRIAGVQVGKVISLSRGPGTTALVTMDIANSGKPIHRDATAEIHPRLFLEGGYFVAIDPGSPSAPTAEAGFTIPLPQTATPVPFYTVISRFDVPARRTFNTTLHELGIAFSGGGVQAFRQLAKELPPTLKNTAIISQAALGQEPNDVSHLIAGSARVTRTLAAHDAQVGDLITSFSRVTSALASQDSALALTVRELDGTLTVAPPALSALDRAMPPLARFATDIRPGLRIAPAVLDRAAALLRQVDALSGKKELPALLATVGPLTKSLPGLFTRLHVLFPRTAPVVSCSIDKVIPTLTAKVDDGALSTGRPVWQDYMHGLVGLAGGAGNFDANGPWVRYLAGFGSQLVSLGSLTGTVSQPIIGSRPQWAGPGNGPAFRPDQSCTTQRPADLRAAAGPPVASAGTATPARALTAHELRHFMLHTHVLHRHIAKRVVK
jgi:virulence factor Mce-like protein